MRNLDFTIVMVSDMDRSVAFYRDKLGFALKFASSHWSEFVIGNAPLALHLADSPARSGEGKAPAGSCRLAYSVQDLDAFHAAALEAGVVCVSPPAENFGVRAAVYADPDGLEISFKHNPQS